ncbi:MAG: YbaN family protein [Fusobacterium sp.]
MIAPVIKNRRKYHSEKKYFYIARNYFFIFGTIGIVIPLLPTTPFYLLSAFLFRKSSERCYNFLLNNRIFGKYIRDYHERKGITLKNKINSIAVLSIGIGWSMYKMENIHGIIFLSIVFICVCFHIIKLPTLK